MSQTPRQEPPSHSEEMKEGSVSYDELKVLLCFFGNLTIEETRGIFTGGIERVTIKGTAFFESENDFSITLSMGDDGRLVVSADDQKLIDKLMSIRDERVEDVIYTRNSRAGTELGLKLVEDVAGTDVSTVEILEAFVRAVKEVLIAALNKDFFISPQDRLILGAQTKEGKAVDLLNIPVGELIKRYVSEVNPVVTDLQREASKRVRVIKNPFEKKVDDMIVWLEDMKEKAVVEQDFKMAVKYREYSDRLRQALKMMKDSLRFVSDKVVDPIKIQDLEKLFSTIEKEIIALRRAGTPHSH